MTVSTQPSSQTFLGNGSTTLFTYTFIGVTADDLEVIYTDADGVNTTLSPSVYTLVISDPAVGELWGIGGTVTYPLTGSPISTGTQLTVNRIVPYTQDVSIGNQGAFYPQAVEEGLDLLEMQLQQVNNQQTYSLKTPFTDADPPDVLPAAAERANNYLVFDNLGQPTVTSVTLSAPTLSAIPRRLLNSGTSTETLTTADQYSGISCYQSGSSVLHIQLPTTGSPYPVFDASNNAATKNITVLPPSGLLIQGASTYVINTNSASAVFYNDGIEIVVVRG